MATKHSKLSTKPDDADDTLIRPSDWNDDHTVDLADYTGDVGAAGAGAGTIHTPLILSPTGSNLSLRDGNGGSVGIALAADTLYANTILPNAPSTYSLGARGGEWASIAANNTIFPPVMVPSADPNTLDAYEEGSFTAGLTCATPGDLVAVLDQSSGNYERVGRDCHVTIWVRTSTWTHSTASGEVRITGLPFTSASIGQRQIGSLSGSGWTRTGVSSIASQVPNGQTFANMLMSRSGNVMLTFSVTDFPSGGQVNLYLAFTYRIA